jgi:hypothetical protein
VSGLRKQYLVRVRDRDLATVHHQQFMVPLALAHASILTFFRVLRF